MPVTLEHNQPPLSYSSYDKAEEACFQALVVDWYKAAEIMRIKPPGTVAKLDSDTSLVMGELNGELYLFESPDLDPLSTDCNLFRPEDWDGIGEHEFEQFGTWLRNWLASPEFSPMMAPDKVAANIDHNFRPEQPSVADWIWAGK